VIAAPRLWEGSVGLGLLPQPMETISCGQATGVDPSCLGRCLVPRYRPATPARRGSGRRRTILGASIQDAVHLARLPILSWTHAEGLRRPGTGQRVIHLRTDRRRASRRHKDLLAWLSTRDSVPSAIRARSAVGRLMAHAHTLAGCPRPHAAQTSQARAEGHVPSSLGRPTSSTSRVSQLGSPHLGAALRRPANFRL